MGSQPVRSYLAIAVAIVIAGVLISASLFFAVGQATKTTTTTTTVLSTTTVASITTQPTGAARLYKVTFQETGSCGIIPVAYQAPWSVTLGNWTEVEPPNGLASNLSANWSPAFVNYSAIVFSVPNGSYHYTVRPSDVLSPASGGLSVSGADLIVRISGPSFLCVGTTGTTTTTTTVAAASQLYKVTFQQEGACSPAVYVAPWSVTLGNITEAEPPGTPLPVQNGGYSAGPEPPGIYTIVFSVPNGTYQYSVRPQGAFYSYAGTVTVNGADVSITLNGPVVGCITTTNP